MKLSYKLLLIFMITLLVLSGCKKKENKEDPVINDPVEFEEIIDESYSPINTMGEYSYRLNYFAEIAFNKKLCTKEYINEMNNCVLTLNNLKKLLPQYDLSILDSFNGNKCDGDKVSAFINMDNSSEGDLSVSIMIDDKCIPFPSKQNTISENESN